MPLERKNISPWRRAVSWLTRLGKQGLKVGETNRYRADVEHEIANERRGAARALMVVIYK